LRSGRALEATGSGQWQVEAPAVPRGARAAIRAAIPPAASATRTSARIPQPVAACGAGVLPTSLRHPKVDA
jgi:hypothetical protein